MQEFNYTMRKAPSVGLRSTEQNKRGRQAMVLSTGAYPDDGALRSVESISELDISSIDPAPSFPFPQIFELLKITLVCTRTQIYSLTDGALTLEIDSLTGGHLWSVADYGHFITLVNGKQVVYRDAQTKDFTIVDEIGIVSASGICDLNGQIILVAPQTTINDIWLVPSQAEITVTGLVPIITTSI